MTQQEEQNLLSSWERSGGQMGNVGGGRRLEWGQVAHHYRPPEITNFPSITYPRPWVCSLGLESLGVELAGSKAQECPLVTLVEYLKLQSWQVVLLYLQGHSLAERGQVLKDTHASSSLASGLHCFLTLCKTLCKALASLRLSPHPKGEH